MPLGMGSQQPSKDMTDRRIFAWVCASHRACLSWIVWLCLQQVAEKTITRRQKHPKSIKWNLWMVKLNEWSCINNFALPEAPENDLLEKVFTCACEAFLLDHQSVPEALCHRTLFVLSAHLQSAKGDSKRLQRWTSSFYKVRFLFHILRGVHSFGFVLAFLKISKHHHVLTHELPTVLPSGKPGKF